MSNGADIIAAKLEFVRDVTVAYVNNIYPKPLSAITDDLRQKAVEQHCKEINEFIKSAYTTINKIAPASK